MKDILRKYIFLSLIFALFSSCKEKIDKVKSNLIFCSAEKLESEYFLNDNGKKFINGKTQSSDFSYSGKHSSKLDINQQYGIGYELEKVVPGDQLIVEIKRKKGSKSSLVLAVKGGKYLSTNKSKEEDLGWETLRINTLISGEFDSTSAKIYCAFNKLDSVAYFDDLNITLLPRDEIHTYNKKSNALNLIISDKSMNELRNIRIQAFKKGYILPEYKVSIKEKISWDGEEIKTKLRFKGDKLDHLTSDKWSFRLKTKSPVLGMKNFSIQKPESRKGILEWFYHKIIEDEGILTTQYEFLPVEINGIPKGLYAIEEHVKSDYLERRNLELSSLITWNDKKMWELRVNAPPFETYDMENKIPMISCLPIKNYVKSTYDSIAYKKFNDFRHGVISVDEAFDSDKLSKLFAIANVMKADHNLVFHNMKFYYNSSTERLEPLAYDGYGGEYINMNRPFVGHDDGDLYDPWLYLVLRDTLFMSQYIEQLKHYSDSSFIKDQYDQYEKPIREYEYLIQEENPNYRFNQDLFYVYESINMINHSLVDFDANKYASFSNSEWMCHSSYLSQQESNDSLLLDVHVQVTDTGIMNYYHKEVNFEYNGSTYLLPPFDYKGYPKVTPF